MGQFLWPDWKPLPQDSPLPPPSPDPEQAIADNTRAEEALNQFIVARQNALFEAPDAFYRTQGSDAIHAAPAVTQALQQVRSNLLEGLANDSQRNKLASVLDGQMRLTRDGIARHVAEQSLAWQRKTAQDRIALLTKEAAYHHNDNELVDALGHAAANAARAHARVGDAPLDPQAEDAAAAFARSGVLGAAIKARLDRGDMAGANTLFTRVGDQLDGEHAAPLLAQFDPADKSGETHQFSANADTPPQAGTQIAQAASSDKKLDQRAKPAPSPTPSPRSAVQTRRDAEWSAIATGLPTSYDGSKLQDTLPDNWQPEVDKVQGKIYAPSYKPPPESAYSEITRQAAEKRGIPPLLLARLINRESSYDPLSGVSLTRESALRQYREPVGMGQMYASAAKEAGTTPKQLAQGDAKTQIEAAAEYLSQQYKVFKDWPKAVAAYHSGPTAVTAWLNGRGTDYQALEQKVEAAKRARGDRAPTGQEKKDQQQVDSWRQMKNEVAFVFLGNPKRYDEKIDNQK